MKKLENHLLKIYHDSGRDWANFTNRQRAVRELNKVLDMGLIALRLCDPGYGWDTKSGFHYNVSIRLIGEKLGNVWFIKGSIHEKELLVCMGKFLQREDVRNKIKSTVHLPGNCSKCNGAGVIPAFYYYADGVCFDCLGSGMNNVKPSIEIHK